MAIQGVQLAGDCTSHRGASTEAERVLALKVMPVTSQGRMSILQADVLLKDTHHLVISSQLLQCRSPGVDQTVQLQYLSQLISTLLMNTSQCRVIGWLHMTTTLCRKKTEN